ncbi:MAG: ATP-dependent RecD-like DNA helicase [Oscillospiraceae bacterium]|nr:ATP-dependent RecD-like DNA helicase [Oscillospiraceae bacterium]
MEKDLDEAFTQIAGTAKAVLFQNEENGYAVVKLERDDGESLTAVGCLPRVCAGEELILTGQFEKHPSHGEQFKVSHAERKLPGGVDSIFEFLSSGAVKGIGPATATLLITQFGEKTLEVLASAPDKLAQVRGISRKKAKELSDDFRRQTSVRALMELLGNFGIKPVYALRLERDFGESAMEQLLENPYIITRESIGASFTEADGFALGSGFEFDSPERMAAAALFELKHNTRNGHCFIPAQTLVQITAELVDAEPEAIEEALEVLADTGDIVRETVAGRDAVYLTSLHEAEDFSAQRVLKMAGAVCEPPKKLSELISQLEREQGLVFAEMQRYCLRQAASRQLLALTGGPGTGKTTLVRAIASLFEKLGLETLLAAPTGRAAKRMSELSERPAQTMHRLLEATSPESGEGTIFRRNEDNLLKCDALILDECSMVDITLFRALLRALPEDCRLVLVGDADQLPSVGPGSVFNDLIRSGVVETVRLTEIFRQSAASTIVACAHMINRGDRPELGANRGDGDFFFLSRTAPSQALETVLELCAERLPNKMGIKPQDIQVLSPMHRGQTGVKNLNSVLQRAMNPPAEGKKEKNFGEICFRVGDRVMQNRNNYDIIWKKQGGASEESGLGVYNGDVGTITKIDSAKETLEVLFEDRLATYDWGLLSELEHAFAMTVHKAQGSEYRAVILMAVDGPPQLMSRKVLYTAVTRARELLIIIGRRESVFGMIDNQRATRRFSGLRARIAEN